MRLSDSNIEAVGKVCRTREIQLPKFESLRAHHAPRVESGLLNVGFSGRPGFNSQRTGPAMLEDEGRLRRALRDSDVNRWHANLAERSELTADIYARRLDRFCEEFKTTPSALWKLDSKAAYNSLIDAVRHYRNKKLTGSTIKGYLKPVISWLRENDIILTKSINISGADKTPTLDDEKSPEPYELHSIWRFCNPREAALIALEAFTGCRPQVFGNYKGTDGLRISDLPEMEVDNETKRVSFKLVPTRVVVRREVSKEGNQYETFLAEEGAGKVAAYLERRMRLGEFLTPISAVIADDDGKGRTLTTKSMYQIVKKPFKRAGLTWRPDILRRYTDVRLGQAAAKPEMGLPESWVTFWMGHHGDIESIYRHKRTLSDSQLEQMREAYARASEMLQTTKLHKENGAQIRREIRTTALLAVGCSDDEIRQLDLDNLTTDEFSEALRQRLEPRKPSVTDSDQQFKVVKPSELRKYVNGGGWKPKERVKETGEWLIESLRDGPTPSPTR